MSIDSSLEEAGELAGASRFRILGKITFPLVVPALLSGFIMTFSQSHGYIRRSECPGCSGPLLHPLHHDPDPISRLMPIGDAFVLAIILILILHGDDLSLNQRIVGTRKSYETIGGRGFHVAKNQITGVEGCDRCRNHHVPS